jgi:hypothetical protein
MIREVSMTIVPDNCAEGNLRDQRPEEFRVQPVARKPLEQITGPVVVPGGELHEQATVIGSFLHAKPSFDTLCRGLASYRLQSTTARSVVQARLVCSR